MNKSTTRFLRALPILLAGGMLACAPGIASAQTTGTRAIRVNSGHVPGSMGIPQPEPKITLSIKQRSLGRILAEIFKQAPYKYEVLADIGATFYSLEVQQVPLRQALTMLLAEDKSTEPLVFSYQPDPVGGGRFIIDREYMQIGFIEGENKVSVGNGRITRVLPRVFEMMKVKYRIEPDVPPLLISLQLRPSEWSQVIPQVMIAASKQEPTLTYSKDGDTYVVHLQKTPVSGAAAVSQRKIKLAATNMPLRGVLMELFKDSSWKYQVGDEVKDTSITYSASNEPEFSALSSVLRQAAANGQQVTYREGKGVIYIEPGPLPGNFVVNTRPQSKGMVVLNVNQLPLKVVVDSIAQQAGITIKVPPSIPNVRVTLKVDKATPDEALQALVEAVAESIPNLQFKAVGTGYELVQGTK